MILTQLFQNLSRRVHLSLHGQGGKLVRKKKQHRFYYSLTRSTQLESYWTVPIIQMLWTK